MFGKIFKGLLLIQKNNIKSEYLGKSEKNTLSVTEDINSARKNLRDATASRNVEKIKKYADAARKFERIDVMLDLKHADMLIKNLSEPSKSP